jgi:hypothetical protein
MSDLEDYKFIAEQAYSKDPVKDFKDWHLLETGNNVKIYQNRNTLEVVPATAGSKSLKDFTIDGLKLLGVSSDLEKKRYGQSELVVDRINAVRRPPPLTLTGHSLGGMINNQLIMNGKASRAVNFNAYIPRKELNIDDNRVVNVRHGRDVASFLTRNNRNTVTTSSQKGGLISSHFLKNIF